MRRLFVVVAVLALMVGMAQAQDQFHNQDNYAGQPGGSLPQAYVALGIEDSVSDKELKQAYRKLMSENQPDKLASRGLPESMRAVAEERSREINKAYDLIKTARDFV